MTLEEIKARVQAIRDTRLDDERAHQMEDDLHRDFIRYVQSRSLDARLSDLATAVLETEDIDFTRWCA